MRQALSKGLVVGGPIAGGIDLVRGAVPFRPFGQRDDAEVEMVPRGRRPVEPDGVLTFDKLSSASSSRATAPATTSRTTSASSSACRASSPTRG